MVLCQISCNFANMKRRVQIDTTLNMSRRISLRLSHYIAHELDVFCRANNVSWSVAIRAALLQFFKQYEEQGGQIQEGAELHLDGDQ